MKPNPKFAQLPKPFWAVIKSISPVLGYTVRGEGLVKSHSIENIVSAFRKLNLEPNLIIDNTQNPTEFGQSIYSYFNFRAQILNEYVETKLMDVEKAKKQYQKYFKQLKPSCPLPMNKQTGNKKTVAYFTSLINMIIEKEINGLPCDYSPKSLTMITKDQQPIRTFSRWIDGAFPNTINPIAIWEIKEYYYTTTFGSRVADGVYETLMDGMEIEELKTNENINILHYLMVDDYFTWWVKGKSYLCRLIDMLHMGYVDEILVGEEIFDELPRIVKQWVKMHQDSIAPKPDSFGAVL